MKGQYIKKLLKVSEEECSNCGDKLVKTHSRRHLQDLTEDYFIDSEIKRCTNKSCSCYNIRIYPDIYKSLIYPKSDYSMSVYATIGYERLVESKTVSEIQRHMVRNYSNLSGLRERSIENIYKRVQVCLRERQEDVEALKERLIKKKIDKLCLSMDGIAPERGNAILYVVREVQSQEILFVRYLEHSDTEHLVSDLLKPLQQFLDKLSIPVGGWICDKQTGFIQAIQSVFSEPIHLCQSHFLKAMGKPVQQADSELAKELKKKLRPLKQIEKDLESEQTQEVSSLTEQQISSLSTLCMLPRTWIPRSISVNYELRGVQMYEQFTDAVKIIKKMEKKGTHPLLSRLKEMYQNSVAGKKDTYQDLKKAHLFLEQLTDILYGKKQKHPKQNQTIRFSEQHRKDHTAAQIQQQVEQLILSFKEDTKKRSTLCRTFIKNFETVYENWKSNLFTCYEYDFLPNDNNALESNHNKVKRRIRKITGYKSTARALLIYGEELIWSQAFFDKESEDFLEALSQTDFEVVANKQQKLKEQQRKRGMKIRIINQTKEMLKKAYNDW